MGSPFWPLVAYVVCSHSLRSFDVDKYSDLLTTNCECAGIVAAFI